MINTLRYVGSEICAVGMYTLSSITTLFLYIFDPKFIWYLLKNILRMLSSMLQSNNNNV
jgi:hypothetical protein